MNHGIKTYRIVFPKQATVAYIDSLLLAVRSVREVQNGIIDLDLSKTTEVSALLICFLCGLVDLAWERNSKVNIILPHNKRASTAVKAVWYISKTPGPPHIKIAETMCQLRKIAGYNSMGIEDMLNIISHNNLEFKTELKNDVRIILTELLTNVLDHSGEKQCYACVGSWGRSHNLHIAFLDFGVGIPKKLRTRYPHLDEDGQAVEVLLKQGLTTRQGIEGGRGYKIIQEILKHNKGRLHIFSGKAKMVLRYDRGEHDYKKAQKEFTGTCVDFQVDLKGSSYFEVIGSQSGEGEFQW